MTTNKTGNAKGVITYLAAPNHSGWTYGKMKLETGEEMAISGAALAGLRKGGEYEFAGAWGLYQGEAQLKVTFAAPHIAANRAGVINFLMAQFKGVGQKKVKDIIDAWEKTKKLSEMYDQLKDNPEHILEWMMKKGFKGVSLRVSSFDAHPDVLKVYRDLVLKHRVNELSEAIVPEAVLKNMAKHLLGIPLDAAVKDQKPKRSTAEALLKFEENPFLPMFGVRGYGFKTADRIWKHLKREPHHPNRLAALGWFVLDEACQNGGHTYLPYREYERAIHSADSELTLEEVLSAMDTHIPKDADGLREVDGRYYIENLYKTEEAVARRLCNMQTANESILGINSSQLNQQLKDIESKRGFSLDNEQRLSLEGVALSPQQVHTVTAMPGCGKTAIMEFLAEMIQTSGAKSVAFMAPTGKAAKVLSGRVRKQGLSATTIHSAIGYGSGKFLPLSADIVVVDEASMVDLQLMRSLLDSMPEHAHLVLIGDTDQLPSVGPGQVLGDVMKMSFDHHQLKNVHRNKGNILNLVKIIKSGRYERQAPSDVLTYGLPDVSSIEKVLDKYQEEWNARGRDLQNMGFLTGLRRGDPEKPGWNITYLNRALQKRFNPEGPKINGLWIREKDRVILRKNQKPVIVDRNGLAKKDEHGMEEQTYVVNGDTGTLERALYNEEGQLKAVIVSLDDGRRIKLEGDKINAIDLGYALTVHQSQGSEFECAFVVMTNGAPGLFNRKLLYTAVSRAKEQLYLFGDGNTLRNLVGRTGDKRFTYLSERVQELQLEKAKEAEERQSFRRSNAP
jgi:exodeoxyribonuclease V alpha subunit